MHKISTVLLLVSITISANAQLKRDSILLYERSIDRHLSVYKGQLRFNTGYDYAFNSSRFDADGKKIKLEYEGITNIRQNIYTEAQYGISNYLQLNLIVSKQSESRRGNNIFFITDGTACIIDHTTEVRGLKDIVFYGSIRVPLHTNSVEILASLGSSIPTAASGASRPQHELTKSNETTYQIHYHNIEHWGSGVPVSFTSLKAKWRRDKLAVNGSIEFHRAFSSARKVEWKYQVVDDHFQYAQLQYTAKEADQLREMITVEYQVLPWIDTFLGIDVQQQAGGWINTNGVIEKEATAKILSANCGIEVLITHRFWLRQFFTFPMLGKNSLSPTITSTSISYSIFP